MAGAWIQFENVSRSFSERVKALENIHFKVAAGDFVSILGPSGCGKSTLLRLAAGLDCPSHGTIQSERVGSGFVFQEPQLLPWRNCLQNVALPLELLNKGESEKEQIALHSLEQVGLKDFSKAYPHELSGGMKMRASLARALVTEPELLFLDEPFAALDELTRFHLEQELRQLWIKRRMTVLFVTHSISEAVFLANRVIVLSARPGKIIADLSVDLDEKRDQSTRMSPRFLFWVNEILQKMESTL